MKTYIKKSIKGFYVDFPEEIDAEYWEDQIGETYKDFLDDKWVLLSDKQVEFHEENPNASIEEVLNMELNTIPEPSVEELIQRAKMDKLNELQRYDRSSEVNEFSINGQLKTWFTVEERSDYKNSIESAKILGIDTLQLIVSGQLIEISTEKAEKLLAMIQIYANTCFIVTEQHKKAIEALNNIVEIEDYDYTIGYPNKLNFDL